MTNETQLMEERSALITALEWIAEYCDELADENADFDTIRKKARAAIAKAEGK